jgi:lysophospholipase L1-like esterase
MNTRISRTALIVAIALGISGSAIAQSNFNTLVVIGDSLAAGFSSASLVVSHQTNSVPALIAKQAGAPDFQQPLISQPGIPPELTLVTLGGPGGLPQIVPKASTLGAPTNLALARPYNNLAVPGATSIDALTTTADSNPFTSIILRGLGSQVAQAVASRPTFVLVWIGNNDVLGAVVNGEAIEGVTLTPPAVFQQVYSQIITNLKSTGATIVVANLPDPTVIPFATTIKPFITDPISGQPFLLNGNPVPLIGPNGPLAPNALVTLGAAPFLAQGMGVPQAFGGSGLPLPDNVILDANKVAIIQAHVTQNNQSIQAIASAANVPVVDINGILQNIATNGRDIGGIHLTAAFLTGGVFSYDGIHPTDLGYAIVANEWISVINAQGGALPPVNLGPYLGVVTQSEPRRGLEFSLEAYERLRALFPGIRRK